MWWGGLNQVSIPQGKFEFSSHPERWVQGRCLGERMPPGLKGWKERGRRHTGQPHSHAQRGLSQLLLVDTFWPQGHKEAGGGPEQMPEPIRGPRTCQGSGPGMRRGPVPGRILNGLPAYLHVLINHKMSPRGRIKLSISLLTSTSSPHTRCSPPDTPASPRPRAFPLPSFLSFRKYSVHHCHGRSPGGEGKGKITGSGGEVNRPDAFISKA